MSILNNVFNWFKNEEQVTNPTKQTRRYPAQRDWTDDQVVNYPLTYGLFHNSYPGMKLAGGLAYAPIAVPVWFMGLPWVTTEDEDDEVDDLLKQITEKMAVLESQIHTESHRDGTIWIWPHFSTKTMSVIWEPIRDDVVTDIIRDLDTGEIIKIITDEQIKLSVEYNTTVEVRRIRVFTKTRIEVKYVMGAELLPESIKDKSMRNPLGILPIAFANNPDADEVRGHSDYERFISTLKDYHDVSLAWSNATAKFTVKMTQSISDTVDTWLDNNGYDSTDEIDIQSLDVMFNKGDQEKTDFIFPDGAYEQYEKRLKNNFKILVESSGLPEIVWRLKTEGNLASVEENMGVLIKFVRSKQIQKKDAYTKLYTATLKLLNIVNMRQQTDIKLLVTWDDLYAVSDEVRSVIFKNFADGMDKLFGAAAITFDQAFKIWKTLYPKQTEDDFEGYIKGLGAMGAHRQWTTANLADSVEVLPRPGDGDGEE